VTLPLPAVPRSGVVALAIAFAVFVAWRVLVAGVGAIAERGFPAGAGRVADQT